MNVPKDKVLVASPLNRHTQFHRSHTAGAPTWMSMLSLPISGTSRLDAASQSGRPGDSAGPTMVAQTTLQNIEVFSLGYWTPPGAGSSGENGDGAGGDGPTKRA